MVPNFSSTTGIQIAMTQFTKVTYDETTQTVDVGAGCLWDQVYAKVAQYKRGVIGGSATQGVGVAGWILGGGYSLKSNQFGLGIDNVTQFQIVLPSGKVQTATEKNREDLFQALRVCDGEFVVSDLAENRLGRCKQFRNRYPVYYKNAPSGRHLCN